MTPRAALTLALAALRSVRYLLEGRVHFPRERVGDVLETADGDAFVVYRETALRTSEDATSGTGAVLVFEMRTADRDVGTAVRDVLFDPLANVATPFFAGLPGFRRKLWLAGRRSGEFLELYEWASRRDGDRFVALMEALLDPLDAAGSASFEVVDADSVDEYVDARSVAWREASTPADRSRSRRMAVVVGLFAAVGGYLFWRRWTARE